MMKFLNYSLSLSLSLSLREHRSINKKFHKTSKIKNRKSIDEEMEMSREMLRAGGAGLSDEQREEMTNREGVAAGGAT